MASPIYNPGVPSSTKQKIPILKLLQKSQGSWAVPNSAYVHFKKANYLYDNLGRLAIDCTTITKIPGENQRPHKMRFSAQDPFYSGKLSECPAIVYSCDCVTTDTWISTSTGLVQVKDLIDLKWRPGDIKNNKFLVDGVCYNGSPFYYKGIKQTYKIDTSRGHQLKLTADHKVKIKENNVFKWKKVKKLKYGDELIINKNSTPKITYGQTYLDGYLVGLLVGDGSFFADGSPDLQLYGAKKDLWKIIKKSRFVRGKVKVQKKGRRVQFTKEFKQFLNSINVRRNNKTLTKSIMKNNEMLVGFMAGIFDTDGACPNPREIYIYSNSKKFLKKIQIGLNHLGISNTKISISIKKGNIVTIAGATFKRKHNCLNLNISSTWIDKFFSLVQPKNKDRLKNYGYIKRINKEHTTKVLSIKKHKLEKVYDATVDSVHSFSANGLIVHNCLDWLYRLEYALWHKGCAEIIYSNGAFPIETNPFLKIRACKHLYRSGLVIVSKKL